MREALPAGLSWVSARVIDLEAWGQPQKRGCERVAEQCVLQRGWGFVRGVGRCSGWNYYRIRELSIVKMFIHS